MKEVWAYSNFRFTYRINNISPVQMEKIESRIHIKDGTMGNVWMFIPLVRAQNLGITLRDI